jgi:hypothetical protein
MPPDPVPSFGVVEGLVFFCKPRHFFILDNDHLQVILTYAGSGEGDVDA